jgi:N-acetylglucosaminyldiphosphoundecaprenol N-acetyl-beta-D-mannosaminyltransferase
VATGSDRHGFYRSAPRLAGAVDILGVPVHPVNRQGILDYISSTIAARQQAIVLHANVFGVNLSNQHSWLKDFYRQAHLVFCDGDGIRWACVILGFQVPEKVTYNVFLWELAAFCERFRFSLYLLGGRPGVADQARANLQARYPQLHILGASDGYFPKDGDGSLAVIENINSVRPDVLLVCFGMPIQEQWVSDNASRLAVHVILTGGAAIDYGAGVIAVAPRWMKQLQMEWFFRLLVEPVRMFRRYVVGNPIFLARVLVGKFRK